MPDIVTLICAVLERLRYAIAFAANNKVPDQPVADPQTHVRFLILVHARIGRAASRLAKLWAKFQSNTLPKPRPSRAGQTRTRKPYQHLPTRHAWLIPIIPGSANHASGIRRMLRDPEIDRFLEAAPQAGRILRPLCRMLGIHQEVELPKRLALPAKPKFPPGRPPAPINLGIINPPDVPQPYPPGSIVRIGLGWYR